MTMTTWQLLTSTWSWDPSVVLGCAALIGIYLAVVRSRITPRAFFFVAGVLVLLFALVSPLDTLGDTYLFSAHMVQHLLLLLIVPPLLLLGIPPWLADEVLKRPRINRAERILGKPLVAWFLGMGTIWLWHVPALYNATLTDEGIHPLIHIFEHLCFLVTATIFWWPVLAPEVERRLAPLATIPYLFGAAAANSVLGIILAYAPPGLYPAYLHPEETLAILPLLRDGWGLTPAVDQQLGGLVMWVPGSLVYLSGIIGALGRWYSTPEEDIQQVADLATKNTFQ
jgi:putative membrane protein